MVHWEEVRKAALQLFDMDSEILDFENLFQKENGNKEKKLNLRNKILATQTLASLFLAERFLLIAMNLHVPATKLQEDKKILFNHPSLEYPLSPKLFPLGYFEKEIIGTKPCYFDSCTAPSVTDDCGTCLWPCISLYLLFRNSSLQIVLIRNQQIYQDLENEVGKESKETNRKRR